MRSRTATRSHGTYLSAAAIAAALIAGAAVLAVNLNGSASAASHASCDIIVPANPLTARGLATPYRLTGQRGASPRQSGCTMRNAANLGAFVQATILDPSTGALSVYEPLVVTDGTRPAIRPVPPKLPPRAVVTIDFGFNGTDLRQVGATRSALRQGRCVNGLDGSVFGQVSFCNGTAFFAAAAKAEQAGKLKVPAAGMSPRTGKACPTTRSFDLVDQDPSDNVTSVYLLNRHGQTAQFSAANAKRMPRARTLSNGSDNALLSDFLDPALGCAPFTARDLSQGGARGTSQALNELSAAKNQQAPAALVPENDEMVMTGSRFSRAKTNLYRANVGQPLIPANGGGKAVLADHPATFCQAMVNRQTPFLAHNQALLARHRTPVPSIGTNLLTFMANRLRMSFTNLSCEQYGLFNPVHVKEDDNGAAVSARFNLAHQRAHGGHHGHTAPPHTAPPQTAGPHY